MSTNFREVSLNCPDLCFLSSLWYNHLYQVPEMYLPRTSTHESGYPVSEYRQVRNDHGYGGYNHAGPSRHPDALQVNRIIGTNEEYRRSSPIMPPAPAGPSRVS